MYHLCFIKYVWVVPLKDKSITVINAFKKFSLITNQKKYG